MRFFLRVGKLFLVAVVTGFGYTLFTCRLHAGGTRLSPACPRTLTLLATVAATLGAQRSFSTESDPPSPPKPRLPPQLEDGAHRNPERLGAAAREELLWRVTSSRRGRLKLSHPGD